MTNLLKSSFTRFKSMTASKNPLQLQLNSADMTNLNY